MSITIKRVIIVKTFRKDSVKESMISIPLRVDELLLIKSYPD
jgi:hypothetical protein